MAFQSEMELLAALKQSEFWQYIESYLDTRRENVFATELAAATDSSQICKAQGAIAELTRLKNLPNLILAKVTMEAERRRMQGMETLNPEREDYDG